jgi:N-methylhydantoinase A/acetophenone carboxylase
MGYTIDIDTGGTFTDGIVVRGQDVRTVKVPTTPHDLTLCFAECIRACADAFELPVTTLLSQTEIVRFCNTIGTNTIIQRDGAKIGLIVTHGCEHLAPTVAGEAPAPLVAADMVAGLREEMSGSGESRVVPEASEILAVAQSLIDRGARALVIALAHSERNATHERQVRNVVKREYPRDYLGSVPVFLASDISTRAGYGERINTAAVNAYIHAKLARLLYKAGEDLRQRDYHSTLFIGHNNGAAARVAKTRAINTYNSGPTAGLLGARAVGRLCAVDNVISTDMGGTSFDIGVVRRGRTSLTLEPNVEGFACNLPMMSIRSLGAGGGSLASVVDGKLVVGPRSAGSVPGPASFDRGGTQPTVTDANLVLGLLDPGYFLGGAQRLDVERARAAIEAHVARPLGLGIEPAALAIKAEVDRIMGQGVAVAARGLDPRGTAIVAYGGAGPLHACAIAAAAGIARTILTPFSAVFSAFSSALMDVGHLYYRRLDLPLAGPLDVAALAGAERSMRAEAERDMRGEGFETGALVYELHFFLSAVDDTHEVLVPAPAGAYADRAAWAEVLREGRAELERQGRPVADLAITSVGLLVSAATQHVDLAARRPVVANDPGRRGERSVYTSAGWTQVPTYARAALGVGNTLIGPALIDSTQTTLYLDGGWRLEVDVYDNLQITRAVQ